MTLKVPAAVAADDQVGDRAVVQRGLGEKYAWQKDRAVQGNPTATILRKTETGGASYARIQPSYTAVSGLEDLKVAVYGDVKSLERRHGAIFESGTYEFVFYNVEVQPTDIVRYDGDDYRPVENATIEYDEDTGRCQVVARADRQAP